MNAETRAKATPEQQAKLIVENLRARQDGWQWAEHVIASALRQAENDKLEEAAEIVTAAISIKSTTFKVDGRQVEDDNGETVFVTASRVNELLGTKAAAIRSLIQKD